MANFDDLIRRWCLGWQASRDLPAAEMTDDGIWIHCRQPGREYEVFARHADDEPESLRRLAAQVRGATQATWLTVTTDDPAKVIAAIEEEGLELHLGSETLMQTDLTRHPHRALDAAFISEVQTDGACLKVAVHDTTGEPAAHGHIGLAGDDAIADRILTNPGFRRRGLGGAIMSALAAEAVTRGVRNGLLIASEEGQYLYSSLGWDRVASVVIAKPPAG